MQFEIKEICATGGISIDDKAVTLTVDNLAETEVTITDGWMLAISNNISEPKTMTAHFEGNIYKSASNTAGYTLADNEITYTATVLEKTFTLNNLNSTAKLGENIFVTDGDTKNFKFKAASLDKKSVKIMGGKFSVELDNDVDTTAEEISESKVLTKKILTNRAAGTGEYYSTSATSVMTGIKSADGVTINGKIVTVNESALDMKAAEN